MLKNKKIALYVTGGIAAYKSVLLLRELIKEGADVRVAMTKSATEFVNPLTFQILSKHHVGIDTFDEQHPERVNHIYMTDWAEHSIIAPATANVIAKMVSGIGDDFVTTTLLATNHPVMIVPAMNTKMYENPVTQRNLEILAGDGHQIMEPDTGFLAEGYEGKGRFPEISRIIEEFKHHIVTESSDKPLVGSKVLISAGGTIERIDPVRYISNDSSGKMGHELAQAAYEAGADVTLVTASSLPSNRYIQRINVESANEMFDALVSEYADADYLIMSAAVSDYAPVDTSDQKMKKQETLTIELKQNKDILKHLGTLKKDHQVNVGFAAETQNIEAYALGKLESKNADFIVANDVSKKDRGFNSDDNAVTVYSKSQDPIHLPLVSKNKLARQIIDILINKNK